MNNNIIIGLISKVLPGNEYITPAGVLYDPSENTAIDTQDPCGKLCRLIKDDTNKNFS